jgi:hypothetical protein
MVDFGNESVKQITLDMHTKTHAGLHVMRVLVSSYVNENRNTY